MGVETSGFSIGSMEPILRSRSQTSLSTRARFGASTLDRVLVPNRLLKKLVNPNQADRILCSRPPTISIAARDNDIMGQ